MVYLISLVAGPGLHYEDPTDDPGREQRERCIEWHCPAEGPCTCVKERPSK